MMRNSLKRMPGVRNAALMNAVMTVSVLIFCILATPQTGWADEDRPNILFIAVDDLRPSVGCYDDPLAITPNLDQLASRGVQFDRAYCQVAVCNPSRASLMTGQRPDKLGVWTLAVHFREAKPDAVTMPQWFRKFGYTAVGHGKIYHNPTPDPQSWSEPVPTLPNLPYPHPEGTRDLVADVRDELPRNDWRKRNLRGPATGAPDLEDNQVLDGARTDMAIADMRRLGKEDEPFFLAVGYIRPHLAWIAPKKYWDLHDPKKFPTMQEEEVNPNTPDYAMFSNRELSHHFDLKDFPEPRSGNKPSPEQVQHLMHGYYACVSYVDAQIGRLMAALEEEGLAENTIVVLWSDHGWKLGEYAAWGKRTNYEIDTRVPLIISAPGMKNAGQRTTQVVELLDLYPTLCELAGIETPDFVDGSSLVPVLEDVNQGVKEGAFSQYFRRNARGEEFMGYAIRTQDHRFVQWREFGSGRVAASELYDHRTDPKEKENIFDTAADDVVERLKEQLGQTCPPRRLVMEPAVHSNPDPGRLRTGITFRNESSSPVSVNLIRSTGARAWKFNQIKRADPGAEVSIEEARIGDVYAVESEDGTINEFHSPSYPPRPIILK